jgi:citrate synthase
LSIRSFAIRGCLLEDDIVNGAAGALRVIFVGLFGRFGTAGEQRAFSRLLVQTFEDAIENDLPEVAAFMKRFPSASAVAAIQYMASVRKASGRSDSLLPSTTPAIVVKDLIKAHIENVAVACASSYMRFILSLRSRSSRDTLAREVKGFLESHSDRDVFRSVFSLLLRRHVDETETRILDNLGAIQIHHGSAGSNMVARYFASLHTRSVSDLFIAAQMAMDCARHFGAINDMTDFIAKLAASPSAQRDALIRQRALQGSLPTFGHPEIAAAGRTNRMEFDPRPAIYLGPLFNAIDAGKLQLSIDRKQRVEMVQRMYQIAFVEGIEKPGRSGRLRIAPNTDFGAWIVQESLGVDEGDRTLLSYVFRGFGWMMDVREQLQQPIIRPVIPPDPGIIPASDGESVIGSVVETVHHRLCQMDAFAPRYLPQDDDAR